MSHVKLASNPEALHAARLGAGNANLVVGCDLVVTATNDALEKMDPSATHGVINATTTPTAEFVANPDWKLPHPVGMSDRSDRRRYRSRRQEEKQGTEQDRCAGPL